MRQKNDIKVISVAAIMFSVALSPLPPASTPYDSSKHHYVQTGSTNNSETETYIDAISALFLGIPSPFALESTASDFGKQRQMQTSGLGSVSTSGLYLMLFSEVGYCRHWWKWIGRAL